MIAWMESDAGNPGDVGAEEVIVAAAAGFSAVHLKDERGPGGARRGDGQHHVVLSAAYQPSIFVRVRVDLAQSRHHRRH